MPKLKPFLIIVSDYPSDVMAIFEREGIQIVSKFVSGFFVLGPRKKIEFLYKYNWVLSIAIPNFLRKRSILKLFQRS